MSRGPGHVMRTVSEVLASLQDNGRDLVDYYFLAFAAFGTREPTRAQLSSIERAVGELVTRDIAVRKQNIGGLVGVGARRTFVRPLTRGERAGLRIQALSEQLGEPGFFDRPDCLSIATELHDLLMSEDRDAIPSEGDILLAMRMPDGELRRGVIGARPNDR